MFQELPYLAAGGILCFTPLTLYLFWLVAVNRGERATVVSGIWDFVALLAGLGGFLLCTGIILTSLGTSSNLFQRGGFGEFQKAWAEAHLWSVATPLAYTVLVGLSAFLTLRARRHSLLVYNVHQPALEAAILEILNRLDLKARRVGNLWANDRELIEMKIFHVFSHVTLQLLPGDRRLREEFEREIRRVVPSLPAGENPAGPWLTTAAVSCLITTLSCVILTFVSAYNR